MARRVRFSLLLLQRWTVADGWDGVGAMVDFAKNKDSWHSSWAKDDTKRAFSMYVYSLEIVGTS